MSKPNRPTGVSVLAILEAIGGVLLLLVALAVMFIGGDLYQYLPSQSVTPELFRGIMTFAGVGILLVSVLLLITAYGLWMGMKWAWYLEFIGTVLSLLGGLGSLPAGIVGIVIDGLILWYLWQPYVKAYFSMGALVSAMSVPLPPSSTTGSVVYCANCGTANPSDSKFCVKCGSELRKESATQP